MSDKILPIAELAELAVSEELARYREAIHYAIKNSIRHGSKQTSAVVPLGVQPTLLSELRQAGYEAWSTKSQRFTPALIHVKWG